MWRFYVICSYAIYSYFACDLKSVKRYLKINTHTSDRSYLDANFHRSRISEVLKWSRFCIDNIRKQVSFVHFTELPFRNFFSFYLFLNFKNSHFLDVIDIFNLHREFTAANMQKYQHLPLVCWDYRVRALPDFSRFLKQLFLSGNFL